MKKTLVSSLSKTSLIIPAYFADQAIYEMTLECLVSLQDRPDEVILVDDGSPQVSKIPQGLADIVIRLPKNKGFAGAVNAGLKVASGDILMQANNDILFTPGWLNAIVKPLQLEYDISSIRTTDSDGWLTEDKITEGDKFGSIWAITREVYQTLGGFDERFGKGFFEDLDYRRRALDAGFRVAKNHAGLVEHRGHATFAIIDPSDQLYERNKDVYRAKHGFIE